MVRNFLGWIRTPKSTFPWVLGLSVISCNAISGIGDLRRADSIVESDDDAGAPCGGADLTGDANNCGTCGHACGTGNFCSASACVQGCTAGLLFVSPNGSDTNLGCTASAPLKTISHGVALAKAQGSALVQEVHVCKGIYEEPQITVDFKSSLRGGYDCTAWKRTTTFGYPTFDATNLTEIDSSASNGASITTLSVGGVAVDASVVIDGFSIHGSSNASSSIALALPGGAPSIQNDLITGGTFTELTSATASIGIQISGGASPEITSSIIDGGGGASTWTSPTVDSGASPSASSIGSVGISVGADSGIPNIHDLTVNGGSGSALVGNGSIAIDINGGTFATVNAIRNNKISGGTGSVTTSGVAGAGIVSTAPGNVEIDANEILGGGGAGCAKATGSCASYGIVAGGGNLIVRGNRIYGGDATGSTTGVSAGIEVSVLKSFVAENNMIHGGNESGSATHGSAIAILLDQTSSPSIRNNTLYSGNPGTSGTPSPSSNVLVTYQVSALTFDNNILAAPPTNSIFGGDISVSCPSNLIKSVQNNAFLAPQAVISSSCSSYTSLYSTPSVSAAQTFLAGIAAGATVSGNVRLDSACSGEGAPTCVINAACTSPSACLAAVIAGWTAADTGESLIEGTGWKINPLCPVAQGGLDISSSLTTDFYGTKRTPPLSIGAHENDAACH